LKPPACRGVSFSNHFASKETFGIEILDLYFVHTKKVLAETLNNDRLKPFQRLEAFIDANQASLEHGGPEDGCLYGTYIAEIAGHDDQIRFRLVEIFDVLRDSLETCLRGRSQGRRPAKGLQVHAGGRFHAHIATRSNAAFEEQARHVAHRDAQGHRVG
jgi:AcrR family transcriptional regulator